MFPGRYFGARYFAPRYFAKVGATLVFTGVEGSSMLLLGIGR